MGPLFNPGKQMPSPLVKQVCWQHPALLRGDIDQTRLIIADAPTDSSSAFSFLALGDTDATELVGDENQFSHHFAEQVMAHLGENRFLLHTGDVAYPEGSYQNYWNHFLWPYHGLLEQLPRNPFYRHKPVRFQRPLLAVPGNHDYAGDEKTTRLWPQLMRRLCDYLRSTVGLDFGHYGGQGGEAYAQTFLDNLEQLSVEQLINHLALHYAAPSRKTAQQIGEQSNQRSGACLNYQPGLFTRLPNRYYTFRYGGIDFFALDSNTWNTDSDTPGFDQAQLDWLERGLSQSWNTVDTIGRIIYLHHSPYTTEASRWKQSETLWVRRHLRTVLTRVAATIELPPSAPLVDLVISGHAHCLEHLKTTQTPYGDAQIDWVVCGGSGTGIRRQRKGDKNILENVVYGGRSHTKVVAQSQFYAGRHGRKHQQQVFHSFMRVDVQPHQAQKITVCPFLVTHENGQWQTKAIAPLALGQTPTHNTHVYQGVIGA